MNKIPPAEPRRKVHLRQITCSAYQRDDGLWDIEAILVDTKPHGMVLPERGQIGADEPVHEMMLRLTLDDSMAIRDVSATTYHSPFSVCGEITSGYQRLIGMRICAGFVKSAKQLFRGVEGCTHLTELLPAMATTAFQAMFRRDDYVFVGKGMPSPVGGCHVLRGESEVVKKYFPDMYTGKK